MPDPRTGQHHLLIRRNRTTGELAHYRFYAFLVVVRADEHTRRPTPETLIPLTCNEIARLFIALAAQRSTTRTTDSAGPTGAAATKPDPEPATTTVRPPRLSERTRPCGHAPPGTSEPHHGNVSVSHTTSPRSSAET